MTIHIQDIALSKLIPSNANVRRTGRTERIEELAASIAAHGILQNLTVRLVDKQRFEVIAGGRRLAALKLLAKRKAWAKDAPIPCQIIEGDNVTEISLAENAMQCPMHPADQFEAFAELHRQQMSVEDIAGRFGVSPAIVTQRLKLGAVSPGLMAVYRAGEMNLDQLSAFAITDNHTLQERVWQELGYNRSRHAILQALNEGQVPGDDCRALYVGEVAYIAAGGSILRDLFDEEGGGFFSDAALLNRLASEKLAIEAEQVSAEGWKWVAVEMAFDYGLASGMRRIYPAQRDLTEAEESRIEELSARYEALSEGEEGDSPETAEQVLDAIDLEIEAIRGDEVFEPESKAIAGAFVALSRDGKPRIERGFVRREHDPGVEKATRKYDAGKAGADTLPATLIADLSAHRTAALANELARQPALALIAVVHALAASTFYLGSASCLTIAAKQTHLSGHAKNIGDSRAVTERDERHASWEKCMPEEPAGLWSFVIDLPETERLDLLAHCASLTVDAVCTPNAAKSPEARQHADVLATALGLDMSAYWQPTASGYFDRLAKPRILLAVREAVSPEAAQTLEKLKKPAMAGRAETLLSGKGWLPETLRATS